MAYSEDQIYFDHGPNRLPIFNAALLHVTIRRATGRREDYRVFQGVAATGLNPFSWARISKGTIPRATTSIFAGSIN